MSELKQLYKELKNIKSAKTMLNEQMSRHTTFKIGGPAKILVIPRNIDALKDVLVITKGMKKYIIGNGSNIIVPDKGINGIVIKISGGLDDFNCDGRILSIGAGNLIQTLIRRSMHLGLSGLEFAAWVPAAIGGAVSTNMGALGLDIGNLVESIEIMGSDGEIKKLGRTDIIFSYRKSSIKDCIITQVKLKLSYRKKEQIKQTINDYIAKRKELQPISVPSAGSIFKNPKDVPAGKLIDMAGCKGLRVGGAEISKKHANFIINLGDAKAADVKALIRKVKTIVRSKFKVNLELELIDSRQLNMLF